MSARIFSGAMIGFAAVLAGCAATQQALERAYEQAGSPQKKRQVLQKLAYRGGPAGASIASRALGDAHPQVREAALGVLGRLARPGSAEAKLLASALGDTDPGVRIAAVRAIGQMRDRAEAARLTQALGDPEEDVRREAAIALGKLGGTTAAAGLKLATQDASPSVRAAALEALAELEGLAANAVLASALTDKDPNVRLVAARKLAGQPSIEAAGPLCEALKDPAPGVAHLAAEALTQLRTESATEGLALAAEMFRGELREKLCKALGEIPGERSRAALLKLLGSPDEDLRALATRALGSGLFPEAQEALSKVLGDPSPDVRREAAYALAQYGSAGGAAILVDDLRSGPRRAEALDALVRIGSAASAALRPLVSDRTAPPEAKAVAMLALADGGTPEDIPLIEDALNSRNGQVRSCAAICLGELGLKAEGAAKLRALQAAMRAARDRDARVRLCGAYAAARLGETGYSAELGLALRRGPAAERELAVRLLHRLDSPQALEELVSGLSASDSAIRTLSALGLAKRGLASARAVEALAAMHVDPEPRARAAAARALGEIGTVESVKALAPFIGDKDTAVAIEAIGALYRSQRPEGVEIVAKALDEPRLEIRAHAVYALAALTGRSFGAVTAGQYPPGPVDAFQLQHLGADEIRDAAARAQAWWLEHSRGYRTPRK